MKELNLKSREVKERQKYEKPNCNKYKNKYCG